MRHRIRGRHLGRTSSHRKAMFRNMAVSLIRSVRADPEEYGSPKVAGRIVTTVAKAKELRPFVEKLITLARKSVPLQEAADSLKVSAEKNSPEWKKWRDSAQWNEWNQKQAPVLAMRRRAFAALRDNEAVDILFADLAVKFQDRQGGYTRVIKLATPRLGDSGQQAFIEFVGENDRVPQKRSAPVVVEDDTPQAADASE
ncbi:MAG: 50S ribosomal protein L17 [Planctomycetaceae bacterium]|nr:50S ribosomal protein L17 [Planctomycetaceae bacterium]